MLAESWSLPRLAYILLVSLKGLRTTKIDDVSRLEEVDSTAETELMTFWSI